MFVICKKFHHKGSLVHINSIKWLIIIDDRIIHFVPSLENIFCFFLVEWYLLDSKCLWVNVWFSIRQMRQFLWWFCWQPTVYLLVNNWLSTSFLSFLFKFPTCWKVLKTITMFPQSSCWFCLCTGNTAKQNKC